MPPHPALILCIKLNHKLNYLSSSFFPITVILTVLEHGSAEVITMRKHSGLALTN